MPLASTMKSAAVEGEHTLLVLADRIHTLAHAHQGHDAVLIAHGRIVATGRAHVLRAHASHAQLLDLRGSTITPGLTDSHIHLTEWAFARGEVDLSLARAPEDAARMTAEHPAARQDGWVRGRGWNPPLCGAAGPQRAILHAVLPHRPVAQQSHDMTEG